ncbi:MAG: hypothetical protein DF168_01783 [Candidatus Moanabacter tarae]|uniref:Uncharacterized protein n=1 Tax=Candidatus Moanibacter tarae TaxID=2200854 RepID=A0A2Z4AHB5_9BACT|nr:MAG: hypothetical protein DF168_01783 [Candidatus Moanabacter tarae]
MGCRALNLTNCRTDSKFKRTSVSDFFRTVHQWLLRDSLISNTRKLSLIFNGFFIFLNLFREIPAKGIQSIAIRWGSS